MNLGDRALIVSSENRRNHNFAVGEIVEFTEEPDGFFGAMTGHREGEEGIQWLRPEDWVPLFSVGDMVKIKGNDHKPTHYLREGAVVTIGRVDVGSTSYAVHTDSMSQRVNIRDVCGLLEGEKPKVGLRKIKRA